MTTAPFPRGPFPTKHVRGAVSDPRPLFVSDGRLAENEVVEGHAASVRALLDIAGSDVRSRARDDPAHFITRDVHGKRKGRGQRAEGEADVEGVGPEEDGNGDAGWLTWIEAAIGA